ncbi:MAG: hypothetical protein LBP67_02965 [Bacteroidales bacterium]|jgi:ATP-dependent Clp protease adaptor protein ClpS|nr:hypothetical protein [Bacteroidales bacterium]
MMSENLMPENEFNFCDLIERSKILILYDKKDVSVNYTAKCLINVCKHNPLQAKQCAIQSKMKGNCSIASGSHEELVVKRDRLISLGLNAKMGF